MLNYNSLPIGGNRFITRLHPLINSLGLERSKEPGAEIGTALP